MSGHSHWAGIKRKKGVADQKRGQVFSKLLVAVSAAAKTEPNPDFNPRLRTAVEKAKANKVPAEHIERAIKKASESERGGEELVLEAYGPGGTAMLIEAITDSKNRTVAETKNILSEHGGKWAEAGSVRWAFEPAPDSERRWRPKFSHALAADDREKLAALVAELVAHDDIEDVYTNADVKAVR